MSSGIHRSQYHSDHKRWGLPCHPSLLLIFHFFEYETQHNDPNYNNNNNNEGKYIIIIIIIETQGEEISIAVRGEWRGRGEKGREDGQNRLDEKARREHRMKHSNASVVVVVVVVDTCLALKFNSCCDVTA